MLNINHDNYLQTDKVQEICVCLHTFLKQNVLGDNLSLILYEDSELDDNYFPIIYTHASSLRTKDLLRGLKTFIRDIEDFYFNEIDLLIKDIYIQIGKNNNNTSTNFERGWLMYKLEDTINELYDAIKDFKDAGSYMKEYTDKYSGVGGFVRAAIQGINNPIDGIAVLFGASSLDEEWNNISNFWIKSTNNLVEYIDDFPNEVAQMLYDAWNFDTPKIYNEVNSRLLNISSNF